jgi:hypothetical protein
LPDLRKFKDIKTKKNAFSRKKGRAKTLKKKEKTIGTACTYTLGCTKHVVFSSMTLVGAEYNRLLILGMTWNLGN